MNVYQTVRSWVVLLLAAVLNVSASVAETLLRSQPRWLAKMRLLAADLRHDGAMGEARLNGARAATGATPAAAPEGADEVHDILASYAILNRALLNLQANGLSLDEGLTSRMRSDWSADSVVGYLESSEAHLQKTVSAALQDAAMALEAAGLVLDPPQGAVEAAGRGPAPLAAGAKKAVK